MDPIKDGKVELNAEFVERFLKAQSETLHPIGKMLGSYYHTLVVNNCASDVAATLVRDMQSHILQTSAMHNEVNAKLEQIKAATAELNAAVEKYKQMMEDMHDGM